MPQVTAATVRPAHRLRGRLAVPGDKSISHRYGLLAALAGGTTTISGYAPGADCRSTLDCLRGLGVSVQSGAQVVIAGRGVGGFSPPERPLDCGNSGTTMRLLAGVLAGHPFTSRLVGDASLSRRPMGRVIDPIERMGGRISAADGHAPLTVHGTSGLHGIRFEPDRPSAQVKSAVLLAGLHAEGETAVVEPAFTRDHTERALEAFGVEVVRDGRRVALCGGQRLAGRALAVPGDFSSAAFWLVGAAALPGSRVEVTGVGLNPTRTALLDVLRRFGARVEVEVADTDAGEPRGTVSVEAGAQQAIEIGPDEVPALIDELPAVAALAARGGRVAVHGASELRVKESDRIATLVAGFRALGISAQEAPDGFVVEGPAGGGRPSGGRADAKGDHRMAMAFAIAALGASDASIIDGSDAVGISYPAFFETLDQLLS